MNKLELENKRLENYHKLDIYAFRPKYNAVEVDINNSLEHETIKFLGVWLIRQGVPAIQLPEILKNTNRENIITEAIKGWMPFIQKFKHEWERPVIITEARFKSKRRADIFILDTGEKIEIETNHKVKKEDSITVYV